MNRIISTIVAVIFMSASVSHEVIAQEMRSVMNLRGMWKFTLGDDIEWASPSFKDADWEEIKVPETWEDEGYPGYDGYAWYRKHFTLDKDLEGRDLYLRVGYVDDVCEVYVNGQMVGFEGIFPPAFITAYNVARPYLVPNKFLRFGKENVIAVRVYDQRFGGGMTHGTIGLFELRDPLVPDLDLSGLWKFKTGDNMDWSRPEFSDERWEKRVTPLFWEAQGHKDYDGYAWYRVQFEVPQNLAGKDLVLLLGKIDDADETYLNGKLLGRTGRMQENWNAGDAGTDYTEQRAYVIPRTLLVAGKPNVLAVRVLDVFMHGGIYDGPVGLVERQKYVRWEKNNDQRWNIFDWLR